MFFVCGCAAAKYRYFCAGYTLQLLHRGALLFRILLVAILELYRLASSHLSILSTSYTVVQLSCL